jgi:hypothetical protein
MRIFRTTAMALWLASPIALSSLLLTSPIHAQETTGSLQGTVKDPSGAVVPGAVVTVSTPTLVGTKQDVTDGKGNYHFANLPPGSYSLTVQANGFDTLRQKGLSIEVGHAPTVDLKLSVGSAATTVEVSAEAVQVDVTSVTTQTTLSPDVVAFVPHGVSFQSVIQFAPAASNEPLMGSTGTNGTGGTSPGSATNGNAYGYSVAGGSDSENSYLVEGQETANLIGGYSHTSVPFDFIDTVEIKSSGIQAEYGGALGGVVNVIMKKGTAHYHGSLFSQYESTGLDANPNNPVSRYDPAGQPTATAWGATDQPWQGEQLVKPHTSLVYPGFTLGGPLLPFSSSLRDKIFAFVGFNPELQRYEEKINYGPDSVALPGNASGIIPFSQNTNTYYTTARVDAQVSQKVRVFASWLYQLQRENGEALPPSDSPQGAFNTATGCFSRSTTTPCNNQGATPQFSFGHNLGFVAPNITFNTGADITLSSKIVSTTRFGYYFENYHDFGYPQTGNSYIFETSGLNDPIAANQHSQGYQNDPINGNFTSHNASKAIQFDQAFAFFKSTPFGVHNFKFGYALNRLSNNINQHYNNPLVQVYADSSYTTETSVGATNCAAFNNFGGCAGTSGYVDVVDYGSNGQAVSYNNGIFGQDSWTLGKGITIDAGIRDEKEFLPGEAAPGPGVPNHPINFGWKDKIAPRLGVAWDVMHNGKIKVFGDYGKFYDIMKLNLAISSFGGQYWQNCYYTLSTADTNVNPAFNAQNRYCVGSSDAATANFAGLAAGQSPAGTSFIENINYRGFPTTCSTCSATEEGVAPNLKPYQQHESVFGTDYQVSRNVAFEVRYDRRRLDRVIEDSSVYNPNSGETFVIVNPGYGINNTFSSFCNFLYGVGATNCSAQNVGTTANPVLSGYPPNQTIPAARSYDGVEFRVTKAPTHGFAGMFSYTYSHFRGNYTGLTSSDLSDGDNGGRNSPNNSRAFDEPYFSYNANGGSSSGLLPTDRPNKFKGYGYYTTNYLKSFSSDFGMFTYLYQGSPNTSFLQDVGYTASGDFPVQVFDRGKWANITQDPTTGAVTVGTPYTYRNPWFVQSDFNFTESYKFGESKSVSFAATFTNVFNEHAVTVVNEQIDSNSGYINNIQASLPGGYPVYAGVPFYAAAEHPYSVQDVLNTGGVNGGPQTINSAYGKPLYYQIPRTIRLTARFTF